MKKLKKTILTLCLCMGTLFIMPMIMPISEDNVAVVDAADYQLGTKLEVEFDDYSYGYFEVPYKMKVQICISIPEITQDDEFDDDEFDDDEFDDDEFDDDEFDDDELDVSYLFEIEDLYDETVFSTWIEQDNYVYKKTITLEAGTYCFSGAGNYCDALYYVTIQLVDVTNYATKITLSDKKVTLYTGTTKKLTATANGATYKGIKWKSSNKSVATVDMKGVITAKKAGKTVITASLSGCQKVTCNVTVKDIAVKKIKLNKTKLTLQGTKTAKLKATVIPSNATNQQVTWTSSNKSVASVSSKGVVTGKKAGTTTITAKAGNKTAKCKVTVKNVSIKNVKLNKSKLNLQVGKTATLKATVSPGNAIYKKITWTTSDKSVATVSADGVVKGKKAGTATITAKAGSKKATCKVTVKKAPKIGEPIIEDSKSSACILYGFGFTKNSVDGVKLLWQAKNNSGKTINYYTVNVKFVNAVGDPAYDEITGKSTASVEYVGPVKAGEKLIVYTIVGCVPVCDKIKITSIDLKYKDGTTETIKYNHTAKYFSY